MRVTKLLCFFVACLATAQTDALLAGLEAFHQANSRWPSSGCASLAIRAPKFFSAMTLAATSRCDVADGDLGAAMEGNDRDVARLAGFALVQCDIARNRLDEAAALIAKLAKQVPGRWRCALSGGALLHALLERHHLSAL